MADGLYNCGLAMLLNLFNHSFTLSMVACINTDFNQFMGIERVVNFLQEILSNSGITDDNNDFEVVSKFT